MEINDEPMIASIFNLTTATFHVIQSFGVIDGFLLGNVKHLKTVFSLMAYFNRSVAKEAFSEKDVLKGKGVSRCSCNLADLIAPSKGQNV